ncbi:Bgt-20508 [Blumeria graminis f. sp. tritici]|uniref:Bgt-20508 n=2 Tax=Blumeria graminis f. sp. tritici TaxID=62690 RepID=A0A9X9MEU5_BLUGR|nr:Bgt-20508 [Blumeria graminis f. sp. tritici]
MTKLLKGLENKPSRWCPLKKPRREIFLYHPLPSLRAGCGLGLLVPKWNGARATSTKPEITTGARTTAPPIVGLSNLLSWFGSFND